MWKAFFTWAFWSQILKQTLLQIRARECGFWIGWCYMWWFRLAKQGVRERGNVMISNQTPKDVCWTNYWYADYNVMAMQYVGNSLQRNIGSCILTCNVLYGHCPYVPLFDGCSRNTNVNWRSDEKFVLLKEIYWHCEMLRVVCPSLHHDIINNLQCIFV